MKYVFDHATVKSDKSMFSIFFGFGLGLRGLDYIIGLFTSTHKIAGVVVQWVERWTCNQQVVGSNPTRGQKLHNNLGKVVHT